MKYHAFWFVGLLWFALVLLLLGWFATEQLAVFDHNGKLYDKITQEDSLVAALTASGAELPQGVKVAIHIEDKQCLCQWVATKHIVSVKSLAEAQGFMNLSITLDDIPSLQDWIPSVPAIILLSERHDIVYAGPYSAGMYCSAGNGIVEPYITKAPDLELGPAVPFDAEGCYCPQ
ncbi:DUF6436 domain-containing protein [Alteromonas facilis]|uniref:DUF6436 domain-containing protein n=1 Tax=Alteromonas facilis TaxID=2048004 RepID=UPI000C288EE5|nr:DUF6436 domain-containing protein [Alteromonas facilis]